LFDFLEIIIYFLMIFILTVTHDHGHHSVFQETQGQITIYRVLHKGGGVMMALAGGLIALVLGIIGIIYWWPFFIRALQAGVPAMLILGGSLATYLGIEEIKDKRASESFDADKDELKREVETLKKEIKEIKGEKESPEKKD
jgi:uncharacterized membrane protein YqjE